MGSYRQVEVMCPFYRTDGKLSITCEGFGDSRCLKQVYRKKEHYETQLTVFCCGHFEKCEVYRLLMETKYEEENT